MTTERRRPLPREDDDTPTRINGNGHGPDTDPPGGLHDIPSMELVEDTAKQLERVASRVDVLITDGRHIRADIAELRAELLEVKATGLQTNAGVFELVAAHREQAAKAGTIALDASQAKQTAAVSRAESTAAKKDAERAIRIAQAARDEANRSSKTEQELVEMGLDLARTGAGLVVKKREDATATQARWHAGLQKAVLPAAKYVAMGLAVALISYVTVRFGLVQPGAAPQPQVTHEAR